MSDTVGDHTLRILREIQSELADMRDDPWRTKGTPEVMISILNRHDESTHSLAAEVRALRSQFDRFRLDVRERLTRIEGLLEARKEAE